VLEFVTDPAAAPVYVGGALVNYADGRESLAFLFDCASWSTSWLVLGHLSLSWVLRDLVPGERRPLLTVQVRLVLAVGCGVVLPLMKSRVRDRSFSVPKPSSTCNLPNKPTTAPG